MTEFYNADAYARRKFGSSRFGNAVGYSKVPRLHAGHFLPRLEAMAATIRLLRAEDRLRSIYRSAQRLFDHIESCRRDATEGEAARLDRLLNDFDRAFAAKPPAPRRRLVRLFTGRSPI
jgi:hypothetical protein